ncbi:MULTISPECIES: 16S rRNA (adenine(1518)-N(6)/adenine(1519)-N(6))-dimethyltransferase RsmA [unclassified Mitsuokella]|uniref:16S rRNA (adenine(1518)-N(6)/adenine(1519)-N(6))- dimethyltransferase RsmA n=1 Tax=unclassified Mitsuokella TaxID=2637239 RepID=UPI000E49149D|nr:MULTISPECIES: 16S rRNA (adenine(1518)-N(6)/adenine(1519)-N(6))-dimethyltransferase RsmA [unclassified Mitsuokella]RGS73719.1 16S rRNA (adenine(1518)-N(6)/adenine(1519)-N(6))-dimethyltransferase RsmA [Mitsuokella sp. AF21-1AC]RHM55329.1 16S rRNA (adenine(1518)-N(6)/adenine(1519)-N(6))-dimethyltransferase RsmA [Mitsuokella sp. AF33-22]
MNAEDEKVLQPKIASREVTTHILKAFGLRMSKKLGQNFLIDARIVQGIVDAAEIKPGDRVLEIGPGIGTLTQGLAEAGAEVTAVELDKKLPAVLKETLKAYDNVTIVPGDILKVNIPEIMGEGPFKVAANLPYYITTPILMTLLERRLPITHMVTMVQKEVAERMTAKPGSRIYGALSVAVQYYTEPEIVLDVPPRSFIPAPEVMSVVVSCRVRRKPAVDVQDEKLFFRVVKAAFGQRRKTLANALRGAGFPKEQVRDALESAGIDPIRRGETLTLAEFGQLADAFAAQKNA